MARQIVYTPKAAKPPPMYSQAVKAAGLVFVSGTAPTDPKVRQLAEKWMSLVQEFTGGDPQIAAKVKQMYQQEPSLRQQSGIDPAMFEYVRKASS